MLQMVGLSVISFAGSRYNAYASLELTQKDVTSIPNADGKV